MKVKSLASSHPDLLRQWHPWRNGKLRPDKLAAGSKRLVWWRCESGHEWQATVADRHHGSSCPRCSPNLTSIPERWLYAQIRAVFPEAVNVAHITIRNKTVEFDIYVPSIKFAVEYDGPHHATRVDKDIDKNFLAQQAGIHLIRVRITGLPPMEKHGVYITQHNPESPGSLSQCLHFIGSVLQDIAPLNESQQAAVAAWHQFEVEDTKRPSGNNPSGIAQVSPSLNVRNAQIKQPGNPMNRQEDIRGEHI